MTTDQTYFSIYYEHDGLVKTVKISDKTLASGWWDVQSKHDFTKGKTLYDRANEIQNDKIIDSELTMQKKFPEIYRFVVMIKDEVYKAKDDGTVKFNPDRECKFWVTEQEEGREIDVQRLCRDIFNSLQKGRYTDIRVDVRDIKPTPVEETLNKIVIRSQYSTTFVDNAPRESNITLAMEAFDGLVIKNGEKVSFNKVVGPRTAARGFKEANIIVDGEFVPGNGGGVCQASTTIFNAVLRSGLRIIESHNHSLPISYVPLGLDAMVSSAADLEFQNNTGETIFFESRVIDNGPTNTALVKIYGGRSYIKYVPRTEQVTLEHKVEIKGEVPIEISGFDYSAGQNWFYEERILERGYPPRETLTYLDSYDGDEIIKTKLIRKSRYKGKPRIVTYEKKWEECFVLRDE